MIILNFYILEVNSQLHGAAILPPGKHAPLFVEEDVGSPCSLSGCYGGTVIYVPSTEIRTSTSRMYTV